MRRFVWIIGIFILASPASAQYQYRRYAAPALQAPQYQAAPANDECPQGRQIRARKSYPPSMTDCQVLDADTAAQNSHLQQRASAPATSLAATQSPPRLPNPTTQERSFNKDQVDRLLDRQNSEVVTPSTSVERGLLVSDPPLGDRGSAQPAAIYTNSLRDPTKASAAWVWILAIGALSIYFAPALIAGNRQHHNALAIAALNLFLGWTFLGWVIAFVWACTRVERRDVHTTTDVLNVRREPIL